MIWKYLYNILLWLDEGANVVFIGFINLFISVPAPAAESAHYTVSQVLAELRERGSKVGCVGCYILTKIWSLWIKKPNYDHCRDALTLPDGSKVPEAEDGG